MTQATKKYLKECKKELSFTKSYDKNLYRNIITKVESYVSDNKDSTYEELCSTYGTPRSMASHSLHAFEEKDIIRKTNIVSHFNKAFVVVMIFLMLLVGVGIKIYHDVQKIQIITEETIIEQNK